MWDLNGRKLFHFEGHEAPVYSVCPHQKENIQVKICTHKGWLFIVAMARLRLLP